MTKPQTNNTTTPLWWNDSHTSKWDRVCDAMKRDWEQTMADTTKNRGRELNQKASDTLAQAVGLQTMPAPDKPNPGFTREDWTKVEPAMRFGYGAREQYTEHSDWDDDIDTRLKTEWNALKTGRTWDDTRDVVRRGWESTHRNR